MNKLLVMVTILAVVFPALALDIDEKLTLRILKLSRTRKTILINRGVEDGLTVGDHAKFYLTTGMIARGVVVKTSPARSVWSLYRIITPGSLMKNKVVYLKIATPVRITPDPTRMVMVEPVAVPGEDIPLSADADALELAAEVNEEKLARAEGGDLTALPKTVAEASGDELLDEVPEAGAPPPLTPMAGPLFGRTWELGGLGHLSGLSDSVENYQPGGPVQQGDGSFDRYGLGLGLEKYFLKANSPALQRLSMSLLAQFGQYAFSDVNGTGVASSFWEGGLGLSFHLFNHPGHRERPILYATASAGLGRTLDTFEFLGVGQELKGESFYWLAGAGFKYYFSRWGGNIQLDYYQRQETYAIQGASTPSGEATVAESKRTLSGPRVMLGLLFRF